MAIPSMAHQLGRMLTGTIRMAGAGEFFLMVAASRNSMKQYDLPKNEASAWMYESIAIGPSLSLAKTVANSVSLPDFTFATYVSESVTGDELVNFSVGGKADAASADKWLYSRLLRMAHASPMLLLVEDWRATRGNEFLEALNFPAIYFGDETYYLLRPERRPIHKQESRIFSNTVPTFNAFAIGDDPELLIGMSLSSHDLRRIASKVTAIVCGAYDGESYVVAVPGEGLSGG